jgi:thymidylate synthase ThyX
MVEVKGKGNIVARIIADSISAINGKRITTFELEYHRYIHSEFMTHRMFSRNAASSRAIPVAKMLETVRNSPAMPIHWGANKPGMQATEECDENVLISSEFFANTCDSLTNKEAWMSAMEQAAKFSSGFNSAGYHKQIVNRLTEPFQMMKVVCTATEYENFFWLRDHEAAQPEIAQLARCMKEARDLSEPEVLYPGQWHTPYVMHNRTGIDGSGVQYFIHTDELPGYKVLTLEEALKISSSCCAQVSYRKQDDSLEKAIDIYDKLLASDRKHASPFEHSATPIDADNNVYSHFNGSDYKNVSYNIGSWQDGVTHCDRDGALWSNNLCGWVQYRALIPDNVKRG